MPAPLNTRKQKITVDPRRPNSTLNRKHDPKNVNPHDPLRYRGRWRWPGEPDEPKPDDQSPDQPAE